MTDFRLGDLASSHLEKVIKKVFLVLIFTFWTIFQLDYKSYFRLRQTCREVKEFIHNSRNISVHMEGIYALQLDWNDLLKSWALCCYKQFANIKVDGLYAVRLEMLVPPGQLIASVLSDQMLDFEKLYDYLEMNRITCDQLQMAELRLSKEQCATLLKLLKPVNIRLHSQESDLFEAVFQSKTLVGVFSFTFNCLGSGYRLRLIGAIDGMTDTIYFYFDEISEYCEDVALFGECGRRGTETALHICRRGNLCGNGKSSRFAPENTSGKSKLNPRLFIATFPDSMLPICSKPS